MSHAADPTGFGKFVPGFDFLQKLAQGGPASLAGWVAPTLDPQALDKRLEELKAVQFWLDQNAAALKATIQALEVQKMTLATLKTMNMPMPGAGAWATQAPSAPAASPACADPAPRPSRPAAKAGTRTGAKKAAGPAAAAPGPAAAMPDPLQFWGALTRQFQQIASEALQDVASRSATAPAAPAPAAPARPAARRRKGA